MSEKCRREQADTSLVTNTHEISLPGYRIPEDSAVASEIYILILGL